MREYTIYNIRELLSEHKVEIIDSFVLDAEDNIKNKVFNKVSFLCLNIHPSTLLKLEETKINNCFFKYSQLEKNLILLKFYFR